MACLIMLVILYVDVISCQNFNLSHIYHIFAEKTHFLKWKFSNESDGIQTWFMLCEMTWSDTPSTFINTKNHLNFFWNIFVVFEYTSTLHLFSQTYSNLPLGLLSFWVFFHWKFNKTTIKDFKLVSLMSMVAWRWFFIFKCKVFRYWVTFFYWNFKKIKTSNLNANWISNWG